MFYSPNLDGFSLTKTEGAIAVSDVEYVRFLEERKAGKVIAVNENNQVVAVDPPPPELDKVKADKRAKINAAADAAMAPVTSKYPATERESWRLQVAEAEAWTADNNAATPFIDGLLARRPGKEKAVLMTSILDNARDYKPFSADVFGQRQALDDVLDTATTVEEVQAITVTIEALAL